MELVLAVVVGLGLGVGVAYALMRGRRTETARLTAEMRLVVEEQRRDAEEQRDAAIQVAVGHVVTAGKAVMSGERELAGKDLDGKKSLIDHQLADMNAKLEGLSGLVREFESERERKLGQLGAQLSDQRDGLSALMQTTQSLREALSSTKARGRWGERMAEDVLRLADFVENVNYRKQRAVDGGRGIPDFTFFLPNDLQLHMDVKFPLDNYLRYCDAQSDLERKRYRDDFLKDVRARIKELSTRDYVDPAGGTLDFVLLFIPNEQLYAFIHEQDEAVLDDAVRQHVVFCSPLTLFVVLALIRQMVENFRLARTSDEILSLLGEFSDQWKKFKGQMEKVGQRIDSAGKEYEALVGTRKRMLEKPLLKIDELRTPSERDLAAVDDDEPPLALEA
ncbi:MAG: DNA recombination protein RmuC [Acidimicrobiia bacterium]